MDQLEARAKLLLTALHYAAANNQKKAIKLLLDVLPSPRALEPNSGLPSLPRKHGADWRAEDKYQRKPVKLSNDKECIKLLKQAAVDKP